MSFDRLEPALWSHIASFLVPPLPKPMSGATQAEYAYLADDHPEVVRRLAEAVPGMTTRKDIRAHTLAIMMRTSIGMNRAASFHLYRTAITDDLDHLLDMHEYPPAHPQIDSKRQLLRRIRNLHIEYSEKVDQPSYHAIMNDSARSFGINGMTSRLQKAVQKGMTETIDLFVTLNAFSRSRSMADCFPILHRVSVGAIFGGHDVLWRGISNPHSGLTFDPAGAAAGPGIPTTKVVMSDLIWKCHGFIEKMFCRAPLSQFCQRSYYGPLSLPLKFGPESIPTPADILYTMHLDPTASVARASYGGRTRWLLENLHRNKYVTNGICYAINELLLELNKQHKSLAKGRGTTFKVEIYANSVHSNPLGRPKEIARAKPADEATVLAALRRQDEERRKEKGTPLPEGIVSWQPSSQSPRCLACGWEFEED